MLLRLAVRFGLLVVIAWPDRVAASCDAVASSEYRGIRLWKVPASSAYFYATVRMAVDADGAPNAYHPEDKGIDALVNAGYPDKNWESVLVADPDKPGTPFVQKDGEFAGYFVSKTALQDKRLPTTNASRYVDAREIPYIVFPGGFLRAKGTGDFGDFGMALNVGNGKGSPFIVADAGPENAELGEVSIRLAESLGGVTVNPRNGAGIPRGRFLYVVFPGSKSDPPWPVSRGQIQQRSQRLLGRIGGWPSVRACIGEQ